MKSAPSCLLTTIILLSLFSISVYSQTTAFNYQGRLTDGAAAANGTYEMQFSLYDSLSGGTQLGSSITNSSVTVTNGIFTVLLDFGTTAFPGADQWLEIAVRKPSDPPGFTTLTPRQQITSSPYSIRTLSATSADSLSNLCVGCVTDAKINTVSGNKVTGTVANAATAANSTQLGGVPANQFVLTTDTRLTNSRTPTGTAGGALAGTYPNPTLGAGVVGTSNIAALPNIRSIQTVAQNFPDSSIVKVALDTVSFSSGVTFDNANDQLVITTPGVYLITGEIVWVNNGAGVRLLTLNVNNGEVNADGRNAVGGTNTVQNVIAFVRMSAGATIYMGAGHTGGGSLATDPTFGRGASLSVAWVSP